MTLKTYKLSKDVKSGRLMLIQGRSGTGKTHQGGLLIEGGMNVLWVGTERKYKTIEHLSPEVYPIINMDFPSDPNWLQWGNDQLNNAEGKSDLVKLFRELSKEEHNYDVIYFDSGKRYAWKLLHYCLSSYTGNDPRQARYAFGNKMKVLFDSLPYLTDASTCKKPCHVIMTWGLKPDQDIDGKRLWLPEIEGKMVQPEIPYAFDDVLTLETQTDVNTGRHKYVMKTVADHTTDGKVSSNVKLPKIIENPNLFDIIKKLEGK